MDTANIRLCRLLIGDAAPNALDGDRLSPCLSIRVNLNSQREY